MTLSPPPNNVDGTPLNGNSELPWNDRCNTNEFKQRSLSYIDATYKCIGCIGHGGFGNVYLAEKKSSKRKVALKIMNIIDDYQYDSFKREINAFEKIQLSQSIVYFRDWFVGPNFGLIEMNYANGGTLYNQIDARANILPYSERRIAWYASQLCDALSFAHQRGVAHHDVKSSNVLVDLSTGGKLVLADFGASVGPNETTVGFSAAYASPELLRAYEIEDFSGIRPDKCDAFGLGCILVELLCCLTLDKLMEDRIAEYILKTNTIPVTKLPWLPPKFTQNRCKQPPGFANAGYSDELKQLVLKLLDPDPEQRSVPCQWTAPLRTNPCSPLLAPLNIAAQEIVSGDEVTLDSIQLGTFVQRGPDWNDGNGDGGLGTTGVIVKLDPDGLYCLASFPCITLDGTTVSSECYRIGAENKFELIIGPTCISDIVSPGTGQRRRNGNLYVHDGQSLCIGQDMTPDCIVVGKCQVNHNLYFIVPKQKYTIEQKPINFRNLAPKSKFVGEREQYSEPTSWNRHSHDLMVEVTDDFTRAKILQKFYRAVDNHYLVTSVKQIQVRILADFFIPHTNDSLSYLYFSFITTSNKCPKAWLAFAKKREAISLENWGIPNERQLFFYFHESNVETNLPNFHNYLESQVGVSSMVLRGKLRLNRVRRANQYQVILARVALGRIFDGNSTYNVERCTELKFHSEKIGKDKKCYHSNQIYPEYLISFQSSRRMVRAATESKTKKTPIETKNVEDTMLNKYCVVCMERIVSRVSLPCGHVSLCDACGSNSNLRLMKYKCPECRATIKQIAKIYL
jgi:serine/threonine protein kinase